MARSLFLGISLLQRLCYPATPSLIQDFGSATVNGSGNSAVVTLDLPGRPTVPIGSIGGPDFTSNGIACNANNSVCSSTVTFLPRSPGQKQAELVLKDVNGNFIASAFVHGIGTAPVLQVFPSTISTFAGNGAWSYVDGAATSASFRNPQGLAIDGQSNIYVADSINQVIRKIAAGSSIVSTVAGNGQAGYSGDGGPALNATLNSPTGLAVDAGGNLFIADQGNSLIRRVDSASGFISTVAGGGNSKANDVSARTAALSGPNDVALDTAGNLYLADSFDNLIRKVTASTGLITTIAGGGTVGLGDGGAATAAELNDPTGIALDPTGNLYIADTGHSMVRRVDAATGVITVVAGNGSQGSSGNTGLAVNAELWSPTGISLDPSGNLYIVDFGTSLVRFVSSQTGIISTLAGNGTAAYSGDGGFSTEASLNSPSDLALDAAGNLFIADYSSNVIRKVIFLPPKLVFPATNITLTSALVPLTLTNYGNASLTFSGLTVAGAFEPEPSGGTDCSVTVSLAAGASCQLAIAFAPTAVGAVTGKVSLGSNSDNQFSSQLTINLAGTGLTGAPVATLSPAALTFSSQAVGTTSSQQLFTLSNAGTATLLGIGASLAGSNPADFQITSTCMATLAPNSNCSVAVTFKPLLSGTRTARLNLFDSAANSPQSAVLTATGTGGALPVLSATAVQFGSETVGTASPAQTVTLTNSGTAALTIYSVTLTGINATDFALVSNTCSATLIAAASCRVTLNFDPVSGGPRTATVIFDHSAGNSPQVIALSGTGLGTPTPILSATMLQFGSETLIYPATPQLVTLTNSGNGLLSIVSLTLSGTNPGDFSINASSCGNSLVPSASCGVTIGFVPTQFGLRTSNLIFTYAGNSQTVTLWGTGVSPITRTGNATADGTYDDRDPRVGYTGAWGQNTAAGRYLGTQTFSNQAGSVASFTFTGTAIAFVYEMQANAGQAQVSIDGVVVTLLLDQYSPELQAQKRTVYTGLSNGNHTIIVAALGTANADSSSTYVIVDAFIVGTLASVYDDADPEIRYAGAWGSNIASGRYLGTQSFSHQASDTASFTFIGTQVTYVFETQGNFGHAQVSIDGNIVTADVDEYSATLAAQQKLVYSGLVDGAHTIAVQVLGNRDIAATDAYIVVDAFVVGHAPAGVYDDASPLIAYDAGWGHNIAVGRYAGTQSYSNQVGSAARFTFSGVQVAYVYETQSNLGHAQVSIDGVVVSADIDEYSAIRQFQQNVVYSGLSNGTHTIVVTVLGTQDAASTNSYIVLDAFFVGANAFVTGPAFAGIYDDSNPLMVYDAAWKHNTPAGRYAGTQSYTNQAGSAVRFTFTGAQIAYVYVTQSNLGHAQVSIDGVVVSADIDEYSVTPQFQQRVIYSGLSNGTHTIAVTALGTQDTASTDSYVTLDAFIVGAAAIIFDDWDPEVIYTGIWGENTPAACYNGTQSYSYQPGATASLTFQGRGISYIFKKQSNFGHAQVFIDGNVVTADLDEYSPTVQVQQQLVYSGLTPGMHTITVSVIGTSDLASSAAYVVVDAFIASP